MALNTYYLSTPSGHKNQSAQSTVLSDMSVAGTIDAAAIHAPVVTTTGTFSSTMSIGGNTRAVAIYGSTISGTGITGTTGHFTSTVDTSKISVTGSDGGVFIDSAASTSLFSTFIADNEISVVSTSAVSAVLAYRSGNTVYCFHAMSAEGLSTAP